MAKSLSYATDLLKLILTGVTLPNLADNTLTDPAVNLVLALHTDFPGEAGDQTTNEISYTGYVRQLLARLPGSWNIASGRATLATGLVFPAMVGGAGGLITHVSIGCTPTAAENRILLIGDVLPVIDTYIGVQPRLTPASVVIET